MLNMTSEESIKISVITVVYNDVQHIEETINSVINQTYDNVEYIVIDGGSTDGTVDVIKKYEDNINYWVSEPDKGIYDAMNKGILKSTGDILNLMNCGDFYFNNDILQVVAKEFLANYNLSFVLGRGKFIHDDGCDFLINNKLLLTDLKAGRLRTICHQAFFYKKKLHDYLGLYDMKYKLAADGKFMYSVYHSNKFTGKLVDDILVVRRKFGAGSSPETILEHKQFYDEIFGKSITNELLILKYYLKKNKIGMSLYNIYENIKYIIIK